MVVACPRRGAEESTPDEPTPRAPAPPDSDPAGTVLLAPNKPAQRRSTPAGPWEGHGMAWLQKLGGSPRDFPGPAAIVAPSGLGLQPTLELRPSGSGDLCLESTSAPLGFASRLDLAGCEEPACSAAFAGELARGATLVLVDAATERQRRLAARLAEGAAESTRVGGALFHTAVPAPLALHGEGFWLAAMEGELLRWSDELWTAPPHRLLLSNLVARGLGRRGLLVLPPSDERDQEAGTLARLGLHLATGGATLVEEKPSRSVAAALRFAADRPHLFARHRAPVALLVPVDALVGGGAGAEELDAKLVGLARIITEAGFAVDPVLVGGSELLPVRFEGERLSRTALVVAPGSVGIDAAGWEHLADGAQGAPVLFLDDAETSPLPAPSVAHRFEARGLGAAGTLAAVGRGEKADVVSRWRRRLDREEEQLIDTARRSDGAVDGRNLPPRVLTLPSWSPETGSVTQHLVDLGALRGEGPLRLDGDLRLEMPIHAAQHFRACAATLHLPDRGESHVGRCETEAGSPSTWATFPGRTELPAWSIVEVRLSDEDRSQEYGVQPIRIQGATGAWTAPTVAFEVPFLDAEQVLSVSLPEFLRVDDPPADFDGNIEAWQTTAVVAADRQSGSFRAESEGWGFRADVRTGSNRVDLTLWVENRSDRPLKGVEALLCASSRGASPFPESGHGRTWVETSSGRQSLDELPVDGGDPLYLYRDDLAAPAIMMESVDQSWVFAHAFDRSAAAGGNGSSNGVCLHSRPVFGDLAPGASAMLSGMLFLGRAGDLQVPEGWSPSHPGPAMAADTPRMPCASRSGGGGGSP